MQQINQMCKNQTTQGHGGGGEPDGVDRAADEDPEVGDDRRYTGVGMPAWPCEHDSLVVVVAVVVIVNEGIVVGVCLFVVLVLEI